MVLVSDTQVSLGVLGLRRSGLTGKLNRYIFFQWTAYKNVHIFKLLTCNMEHFPPTGPSHMISLQFNYFHVELGDWNEAHLWFFLTVLFLRPMFSTCGMFWYLQHFWTAAVFPAGISAHGSDHLPSLWYHLWPHSCSPNDISLSPQ